MRLNEMHGNVLLTEVVELIRVEEMTTETSKGINASAHSCLLDCAVSQVLLLLVMDLLALSNEKPI